MLKQYLIEKIVMILDNVRLYHTKRIQPLDQHQKCLKLVFLPTYSPELNLIEGLWKWLKVLSFIMYFTKVFMRLRKLFNVLSNTLMSDF